MALRTLVIAEKPAQGREIAKALGAFQRNMELGSRVGATLG